MTTLLTDAMLGRLTTYLRMCGYDTVYAPDEGLEADDEIREYATRTGRRLLTRDRALAAATEGAVLLEHREIRPQLREVRAAGLELALSETPERCSTCNGAVVAVGHGERTPGYAPDPVSTTVWRCRGCGQHFWKGSHWDDVGETLGSL